MFSLFIPPCYQGKFIHEVTVNVVLNNIKSRKQEKINREQRLEIVQRYWFRTKVFVSCVLNWITFESNILLFVLC